MKKTMLCGVLFTLISSQGLAEETSQAASDSQTNQVAPATQVVPIAQVAPTSPTTPVIDCTYKIPPEIKTVDKTLVLTWSKKAAAQAFEFNPATVDAQLELLKLCFTAEGWSGFDAALQKSGNVEAIKTQKLNVTSTVDGKPQLTDEKNNQWKIALPLQVVYQNEKEKVTQLLNINITVGRKLTGELGIVQMIASARPPVSAPTIKDSPANSDATNNPSSRQKQTPTSSDTTSAPSQTN